MDVKHFKMRLGCGTLVAEVVNHSEAQTDDAPYSVMLAKEGALAAIGYLHPDVAWELGQHICLLAARAGANPK